MAELVRRRGLIGYLVLSSLKTANKSTYLGYVWWVLDPLLMKLVYVLLVRVVFERGGPDYAFFVLLGILH